MAKKVHILGISPCYAETAKKTAQGLFMNKAERIDAVFARRKDDSNILAWLKEQFVIMNKGINLERSEKITHINNATIFYDSKFKFILDYVRENLGKKNILIFAGGDPNFFGIGGSILRELKTNEKRFVEIYPAINFMQIGFSKLKIPMTDSYIASVHGRDLRNMYEALYSQKRVIGIYTDDINTPYRIYTELEEKGFISEFDFYVLTDLCSNNEKIYRSFTKEILESLSNKKNIVIIERKKLFKASKDGEAYSKILFQNRNQIFGIEDEKYVHIAGEPTKKEIRAISISLMNLKKDSVIIDAGCGSGSISIEASAIAAAGVVYAIDNNETKIENLKKNIKRFQRPNIVPILGELPEAFNMFKENTTNALLPDAIFIGGGSKYLEDILTESFHILKNEGVIVVNSILLSSFNKVMSFVGNFNAANKVKMKYEVIAANIARLKTIKSDSYFHALNQIYITKIVKHNNTNTGFKFENKTLK